MNFKIQEKDFKILYNSLESDEMYEYNNKIILNFYKDNSRIDFQEANIMLINMINLNNKTVDLNNKKNLMNCDDVKDNSLNFERKESIDLILNKINPSDIIEKNNDLIKNYDYIISRKNKPQIIIISNENNYNINESEINNMIQTCIDKKCSGIILSHNSGIIGKNNYEIEMIGSNIIIYIHFSNYSSEKIQIAINIIDNIAMMLTFSNNDFSIARDILKDINNDYRCYTNQKNDLQKYIKDVNTNILNQLEHLKLKNLNNFLDNKFPNPKSNNIIKCDLCKMFTTITLKGMAAHKRGCKKKIKINDNNI